METYIQVQTIVSSGLLLLGGIYVFMFKKQFGSYLSKKGENEAIKEDIEDLTKLVKEIERSIDTSKHIELLHIGDKKAAIDNFSTAYFEWLSYLVDRKLGNADFKITAELLSYWKMVEEKRRTAFIRKTQIEFIINDVILNSLLERVYSKTRGALDGNMGSYITGLIGINWELEQAEKLYDNEIKNAEKARLFSEKTSSSEKLETNIIICIQELKPLFNEFIIACQNHVNGIPISKSIDKE